MRVIRLSSIAASIALCLAALANYVPTIAPNGFACAKGHLLVQVNGQAVHKGDALFGGVVETYMPQIHVAVVSYPSNVNIFSLIPKLQSLPNVGFAEPDYMVHATFIPNDTYWSSQWGPQKIGCPAAWDVWQGDPNTIIAIVDTGMDYNHPDLLGKYVGGYDFVNNDSDPMDDHGHGTHCSGIAAANTNNGTGVAGVSFNCRVMACKVLDSSGSGYDSWVAEGINYATDNGAKVVSMSLGGAGDDATLDAACFYAWNNGVVVCAAAGNNGSSTKFFPAACPACIAVASTDNTSNDSLSYFSNYGADWVDVAAPGNGILSTTQGSYQSWSGTSMATPHVSGSAALIYSKIGGARSQLSAVEVRYLIENNCDPVAGAGLVAHGRINVGRAIAAITGPPTEMTFLPSIVTPIVGSLYGGNVQSLWATDGNKYQVMSGIIATFSAPGRPTQNVYGSSFYAEYNVGSGAQLAGYADLVADSVNPLIGTIYIFNWTRGRWEGFALNQSIGSSGLTTSLPLPMNLPAYTSNAHKMRIKVDACCPVPFIINTDLLKLRTLGY